MKLPTKLLITMLGIGFMNYAFSSSDTGTAHVIINNTTVSHGLGLKTNLGTSTWCTKEQALYGKTCNSLGLNNNELQVIQSDSEGNLVNQIGFNNPEATSFDNAGTDQELRNFRPGEHTFKLEKYRNAANTIHNLSPSLPPGSYGTITFEQLIRNIANAQPMYGIVRVLVPLAKNDTVQTQTHSTHQESDDDDGSDDDGHTIKSTRNKYRMCGEKPTDSCSYCGPEDPSIGTRIIPGGQVCGINIDERAKIEVYGSLMFDFVDCADLESKQSFTEVDAIPLSDMPENPRDIYFMVDVPININPANLDPISMAWKDIDKIPGIIGNNKCPGGSPCSLTVNNSIPYSLVTDESKDQYLFNTKNSLSQSVFNSLTQAEKYELIFPSGYVDGWKLAFDKLGISPSKWRSLGFGTPGDSSFSKNNIRSLEFEDIPVYMYSGGLVDMHHHVNISGLVYVPQAIEMEQVGIYLETGDTQTTHCEGDKDGDGHHDDDGTPCNTSDGHADDDDSSSTSTSMHSDDSGSTTTTMHTDDDDSSTSKNCCGDTNTTSEKIFIPAKQYINGAVMVRDSFFIQAIKPGGISIINNDPNTYSQIITSVPNPPKIFEPPNENAPLLKPGATLPPADGGGSGSPDNNDGGTPDNGDGNGGSVTQKVNPGAQWIEIHPQ